MSTLVLGVALAALQAAPLARFEFSRPAMGSEFRIIVYAPDSATAARATHRAFDRIDQIESRLSDWDPESEVSRLAETAGRGDWIPVSDDLWAVLSLGQEWSETTGGAFDVTAGPLTRLWRWANRRGMDMPEDRRSVAMQSVGWDGLELDPATQRVRLARAGMRVDLGGLGKGYAADQATALLSQAGFEHALVDAGGDIRAGVGAPDGSKWRIGLPTLTEWGRIGHADAALSDMVLATSGDRYRHTQAGGVGLSHILDPRSGRSVATRRIVTVVIHTDASGVQLPATLGDLLATAASVMSREELEQMRMPVDVKGAILVLEFDDAKAAWTSWTIELNRGDR